MDDKKVVYTLKIIIIGDPNVGKTNIVYRFSKGEFKNEYENTICLDFLTKNINIDNTSFRLQIWDTAGSEQYRSITRTYYRNSACAIIVYDISNKESFENIPNWILDCKQNNEYNIHMILVGNKDDLVKREVSEEQGKRLAEEYGLKFYEASALTGHNIEEIFIDGCLEINNKINNQEINLENTFCGVKRLNDGDIFVAERSYNSSFLKLGEDNHEKNEQNNQKQRKNRKRKYHC